MFSTELAAEHLQTTASTPSSSLSLLLLLISLMFVSRSIWYLIFTKSLPLILFSFFHFFLFFSVLFHFFVSLLIKRILLSWELIKTFLPPLTSLKYVHVTKCKAIYILCKWCRNVCFERKKKHFCKQDYRMLFKAN